ncbi:MAG: signal recognition particle-docking protein FtsY [Buchnera aphidicola (Brevicoryne brassicae)]|uniref:Signal recognition particle receptor FtsY n=1 Tax=Buchnera aphidicola (Brevicoryne brassicae) TaxID=911343 RepID=A0AAJ5PUE1_9GAMM|nr:signal recognition particle-docking protein FtsY [Buchnera aphidicola]QCI19613.1 signal recognition particle-docking protein FtsY [Buchnera aphidicola (Brevicoryne brassicae)]WAI18984.1 MAG: signal recognition particle-docking protein FtsY [Buchnera aphidicola (Brevicoryne brassicae)]
MKDEKKNGFFSWFSSTIRRKKTVENKEETENKNNDLLNKTILDKENKTLEINQSLYNLKTSLIQKNDIKGEKIEILNNNNSKIIKNTKINFFARLKKSLNKTKKILGDGINHIFLSTTVDKILFEELEEKMLLADIGVNTTDQIINNLIKEINYKDSCIPEKVYFLLKKNMYNILQKVEKPLKISNRVPFVILVVGVNGTGKTTTVVKLAQKYKLEGKSVILAAGDTFRAAGIEQLQILGKLNKIPVIAQSFNSDPAAVVFDAIKSAKAKKVDVLIIDTAGRLHNKLHLIEELKKIVRVIKKIDASAPHETVLTVDACNGQNTISQTEIFHKALNLTGIIITKLDGTAKGGVVFSLANQFKIPIRYVGIGEKTQDLGVFNGKEFINAIFSKE